jgi:tRNA(fMet)-specific endonuclease VapC
MIVADTDVLIDFLSGRGPGAKRVPLEVRRGQLHTTVVNQFELLAGVRSPKQEAIIRSLLGAMTTLSLDASAADQAARIRRDMERQGQSIGMGDSLIAGIVILHEGTLLTRNRRHFDRVPGLKLAEWQD